MRIHFVSDLHIDQIDGPTEVAAIATTVCEAATPDDVLILGGDYADRDERVAECLDAFAAFPGTVLGLAGNHDGWVFEGDPRSSQERITAIHGLLRERDMVPLTLAPVTVGDTTFVGSIGWYDYSFGDAPGVPPQAYASKTLPGTSVPIWRDAVLGRWGMSDIALTEACLEQMRAQLGALSSSARVVVAMHHVPTKSLLYHPREVLPMKWRFANAFLGSERFAELFDEFPQIDWVLCGHIHMRKDVSRGPTQYVSNGAREAIVVDGDTFRRLGDSRLTLGKKS